MSMYLSMQGKWSEFFLFRANIDELKNRSGEAMREEIEKIPFKVEDEIIGRRDEIENLEQSDFAPLDLILNKALLSNYGDYNSLCVLETELLVSARIFLKKLGY